MVIVCDRSLFNKRDIIWRLGSKTFNKSVITSGLTDFSRIRYKTERWTKTDETVERMRSLLIYALSVFSQSQSILILCLFYATVFSYIKFFLSFFMNEAFYSTNINIVDSPCNFMTTLVQFSIGEKVWKRLRLDIYLSI